MMKYMIIGLVFSVYASTTSAQSCWNEWEYKSQMLQRAGSCTENISMRADEFSIGFCKAKKSDDVVRQEAKCPASVKTKEGAEIVTQTVVARCEGLNPLNVTGKVRILYYGGKSYESSKESLRDLCVGLNGKWHEGAK